jgi:hypothetical protein
MSVSCDSPAAFSDWRLRMLGFSEDGIDPRDPSLFLHDIDLNTGLAGFVRTGRAALSAEPFLDHRWRAPEKADATVSLSQLPAAGDPTPRINFIWHTSFCASTLLAACLDSPGRCLALKEPRILVLLAAMKRSGRLDGDLAKAAFGLLARSFEPDEQILIKPSNGANNLMVEAAAMTRGRALLLYSDCESFVLSMARQGRAGFAYVRDLFRSLAADGHPAGRWPAADLLRLTDLELAALVWRMQMDALEAASARLGDRARSLDCQILQEDPDQVLSRLDDFFGLGLGRERLLEVVDGPRFQRDAKRPGKAFDAHARTEERAALKAHLGADLPAVLKSMGEAFPRPPRLAPPLWVVPKRRPSSGAGVSLPAA